MNCAKMWLIFGLVVLLYHVANGETICSNNGYQCRKICYTLTETPVSGGGCPNDKPVCCQPNCLKNGYHCRKNCAPLKEVIEFGGGCPNDNPICCKPMCIFIGYYCRKKCNDNEIPIFEGGGCPYNNPVCCQPLCESLLGGNCRDSKQECTQNGELDHFVPYGCPKVCCLIRPAAACNGTFVGCYCDLRIASPLLSVTLFNDRDFKAVDWTNWNDYSCDLACRCSKEAKARGYKYFGLSFYGICRSGPGTKDDFKDAWFDGHCTGIDESNHEGCLVGKRSTTAVYALDEPQ